MKYVINLFLFLSCFTAQLSAQLNFCGSSEEAYTPSYLSWYDKAVRLNSKRGSIVPDDTIYRIPVVFHFIITKNRVPSIELMTKRITDLTHDFRRKNGDADQLRLMFWPVAGDARIEFVLADTTPAGLPTIGSTVRYSNAWFGKGRNAAFSTYHDMKYTARGGTDAWDTKKYLNIWICDLMAPDGLKYLAGFATYPSGDPGLPAQYSGDSITDGVVIDMENFFSNGINRVLTHEVGHYLGLVHIGVTPPYISCTFDDRVFDTPKISQQDFICDPSKNSCDEGPGDMPDMYENYMSYGLSCQNTFTAGQAVLMRYCLKTLRMDLPEKKLLYADKDINEIRLYPNPSNGVFYLQGLKLLDGTHAVAVYDACGKKVFSRQLNSNKEDFDLSYLAGGLYFVTVTDFSGNTVATYKLGKF